MNSRTFAAYRSRGKRAFLLRADSDLFRASPDKRPIVTVLRLVAAPTA